MEKNNIIVLGSNHMVAALFGDPRQADLAYKALLDQGYTKGNISVVMSDETCEAYFKNSDISKDSLGNKAVSGMGVGGAIGGSVGAISAAIAAMGTTLAIPGIGLVISGALAAAFAGAGAGAVAGGLIGSLIGYGILDEQAKLFENGIKHGGVAILVQTDSEEKCTRLKNEWYVTHTNTKIF